MALLQWFLLINEIFVSWICVDAFSQVHLITLDTERSMVNNNNQGTVCQVQVTGIGLQPKIK